MNVVLFWLNLKMFYIIHENEHFVESENFQKRKKEKRTLLRCGMCWMSVRWSFKLTRKVFVIFFSSLRSSLLWLHKECEEWQPIFGFHWRTHIHTFFTFRCVVLFRHSGEPHTLLSHGRNWCGLLLTFRCKWKILMAIFILWLFFVSPVKFAHPNIVNT